MIFLNPKFVLLFFKNIYFMIKFNCSNNDSCIFHICLVFCPLEFLYIFIILFTQIPLFGIQYPMWFLCWDVVKHSLFILFILNRLILVLLLRLTSLLWPLMKEGRVLLKNILNFIYGYIVSDIWSYN